MSQPISPSFYRSQASAIARDHEQTGVSPTDAVAKCAQANQLNYEQTRRLGEATNRALYDAALRKRAGGDVRYARVECRDVADALHGDQSRHMMPKAASAEDASFYESPGKWYAAEPPALAKVASAGSSPVQAPADEASVRLAAHEHMGIIKLAEDELKVQRMSLAELSRPDYVQLRDLVRDMVTSGTSPDTIVKAAFAALPDDRGQVAVTFSRVFKDLGERGDMPGITPKQAAAVDPKHLSDRLESLAQGVPVQVNHRHPLCIALKGAIELGNKTRETARGLELLGTMMRNARRIALRGA